MSETSAVCSGYFDWPALMHVVIAPLVSAIVALIGAVTLRVVRETRAVVNGGLVAAEHGPSRPGGPGAGGDG